MLIEKAYGTWREQSHNSTTSGVVAVAAAFALVARLPSPWTVIVAAPPAAWLIVGHRRGVTVAARLSATMAMIAGCVVLAVHADRAWSGLSASRIGPFTGWTTVIGDPQPFPSATRVIVGIDGERFEWWIRGSAARRRVAEWDAGDRVLMSGERRHLSERRRARVAWQHVVGVIEVDYIADRSEGGMGSRASNRIRLLLDSGSRQLPADQAALFRGLVIGDDADEPTAMVERFRASGMSHLTAVSGQNVAFMLAAAGPLLRRCRPWWRWALTLGLVLWFVALTRFEPSIMRAGVMAAISATGFLLGRERAPLRTLAAAVIVLIAVDPLIVASIGFVLSVGATAGVIVFGPMLSRSLRRFGWMAEPLGITLGAQIGVAIPSLLVFGRLPIVSIPANLMAVPVAGGVMLYGLPAGLLAGAVPSVAPLAMAPCRVGVAWVDAVAAVAAAVRLPTAISVVGWAVTACIVATVAGGDGGGADTARDRRAALNLH